MTIRPITFVLLLLIGWSTWSCQSKKDSDTQTTAPSENPAYPQLSREELTRLFNTATQVDIIFFNHPVSVNQDNPASVRNTVKYISPDAPANPVSSRCKALGRMSWQADGEIIYEADVYIEEGCMYLLFMRDNKPIAAHALAREGFEFFNTILNQVNQVKQQMQ
jgi:hypothetical protein